MSFFNRAWTTFSKVVIVICIVIAFAFGMTGTVYLSLRSPEVTVPEITGKDRKAAEEELNRAGLNIRVRATRYSADAKPDTILLQLPRAGEVVKTGQTVAVDVSRAQAKEGESSTPIVADKKEEPEEKREGENKNDSTPAPGNQNENQNQNKRTRNKNANNSNNQNNSNNRNSNNANNRNGNNANRTPPVINRNTSNVSTNNNNNRGGTNANANKRAPTITPPFNPGGNTRTP